MPLQKRVNGANDHNNNGSSFDANSVGHRNINVATTPHKSIIIEDSSPPPQAQLHSPSPNRIKKHHTHKQSTEHTSHIMLILFCIFILMLNTMHRQIDQFEQETKEQTHFLRKEIDKLLFDPLSLPQFSNLKGKYSGCLLIDGMIAPHNYKAAPFVDKDIEIVNGTGTHLINRHRLKAYDYDEVKGLVAAFNNAFVYGSEPIVYDCHVKFRPGGADSLNINGFEQVLAPLTISSDRGKQTLGSPYKQPINIINGSVVLISQFWGERYYHWMSECFPRIALVKDYLDSHPDAKLLFFKPGEANKVILKMIGVDPDRIIPYSGLYHIKHLLVPTATAEGRMNQRAGAVMNKHLREAIEEEFNMPQQKPGWQYRIGDSPSIIIQQRAPGGSRSMTNCDDLVKALQSAYPRSMIQIFRHDETIWNAMLLHYGADLVVGPHGAGESNALFMRPGSVMLEIHMKMSMPGPTPDWINPCHNHTSNAVGVKHHYVRAKSGSHGSPMEVDIDVVMQKLLEIFPYNSTYGKSNALSPGNITLPT